MSNTFRFFLDIFLFLWWNFPVRFYKERGQPTREGICHRKKRCRAAVGPLDGHDIRRLIRVLKKAKAAGEPVLLHVVTEKGRGYVQAEQRPDRYHGVAPSYNEPCEVEVAAANGSVAVKEFKKKIFICYTGCGWGMTMYTAA